MFAVTSYTCPADGSENEDDYAVEPHPRDTACRLYAVADGQGGQAGAAPAAQTACRAFIRIASGYSPRRLTWRSTRQRIMRLTDKAVAQEPAAGFTTLVAGCITPTTVYGAASGDSAALLAIGRHPVETLTAGQTKVPPVGSAKARFTCFSAALGEPWTLLVMTDGVWKYTGWEPIFQIVAQHARGRSIIDALRDRVTMTCGLRLNDDFTIVVIQNHGK